MIGACAEIDYLARGQIPRLPYPQTGIFDENPIPLLAAAPVNSDGFPFFNQTHKLRDNLPDILTDAILVKWPNYSDVGPVGPPPGVAHSLLSCF